MPLALPAALVVFSSLPAMAGTAKVDICHVNGNGSYSIINISASAVPAHLTNHGDWIVTEEVCLDVIDNDCDGEIDERDSCMSLEGSVVYASDYNGDLVCDATIDLVGTQYSGDCQDCAFAFDIDATLARDDGTADCSLDLRWTYLEGVPPTYVNPRLFFWETFLPYPEYPQYAYYNVLATGFSIDRTAYGGGYYAGPYFDFIAYDGSTNTATLSGGNLRWSWGASQPALPEAYVNDCGTLQPSSADQGWDGSATADEDLDTTAWNVDVWSFTVPAEASGEVYVTVDTTSIDTASDLAAYLSDPTGCTVQAADDNWACTYPPPAWSCPSFVIDPISEGTYEVMVWYTGAGAASTVADYQIRIASDFDTTLTLVTDDFPMDTWTYAADGNVTVE
jgi:hypothetical protein